MAPEAQNLTQEKTLAPAPENAFNTCLACSRLFTDEANATDGVCSSCQTLAQKLAFVPETHKVLEKSEALAHVAKVRGMCYLPAEALKHIVTLTACYVSPQDISHFIRFRYKHPATASSCLKAAIELSELVTKVRDDFEKHPVLPIAHLTYRLKKLQDLIEGKSDPKVQRDALLAAHDMMKGKEKSPSREKPELPTVPLSERI